MNSKISDVIKSGFLFLLLVVPFMSFGLTGKHDCLIANVNIVDVKTGKILKNKTIAIDNNSITAIYDKNNSGSTSTIVIDGNGKYLIPGLWDMHAHYKWSPADLDLLLIANGITGIREMWGDMPAFVEVPKRSQQAGPLSPDIYLSGDLLDGNPPSFPSGCLVVATPDDAADAVQKQIEKKVDFIKVYMCYPKRVLWRLPAKPGKGTSHLPVISPMVYQSTRQSNQEWSARNIYMDSWKAAYRKIKTKIPPNQLKNW
jgi:hypothetical protein